MSDYVLTYYGEPTFESITLKTRGQYTGGTK